MQSIRARNQQYRLLPYNQQSDASMVSVYIILGGLIAPAGFQALYTSSFASEECGVDTFRFTTMLAFLSSVLCIIVSALLLGMLTHLRTPSNGYTYENASWCRLYEFMFVLMQAAMACSIVCWLVSYFVAAACFFPAGAATKTLLALGIAASALIVLSLILYYGMKAFARDGRSTAYNIDRAVLAQQMILSVDDEIAKATTAANGQTPPSLKAVRMSAMRLLQACQENFRFHETEGPLPRGFLSLRHLYDLAKYTYDIQEDTNTKDWVLTDAFAVRDEAYKVVEQANWGLTV